MEEWTQIIGKKIKVIYDDNNRYPTKKVGILLNVTPQILFLNINGNTEGLSISRIIRFEVLNE